MTNSPRQCICIMSSKVAIPRLFELKSHQEILTAMMVAKIALALLSSPPPPPPPPPPPRAYVLWKTQNTYSYATVFNVQKLF